MRLAVTFCNQRVTPALGLAVVDDRSAWVPLPEVTSPTGATGMTFRDGSLLVAIQAPQATIVAYDAGWNASVTTLDGARDLHDLCWDGSRLLVASSGNDRVLSVAGVPEVVWATGDSRDEHHVNGVASDGRRMLVTFFGSRADRHWSEVVEGRVVDAAGDVTVVDALHHPHSPRLRDSQFWVCESGRGDVVVIEADGSTERLHVGGYTRGLWIGDDVVAVGVSAARGHSRSEGTTNVVARGEAWSGVVLIDRHRLSIIERIDLTALGAEVFDVTCVDSLSSVRGDDAAEVRTRTVEEAAAAEATPPRP